MFTGMVYLNLFLLVWIGRDVNCLSFIGEAGVNTNLTVPTENGLVQGRIRTTQEENTPYYSFQGIPYALPPIKDLRFKAPEPISNWKGVLDATKKAPGCIELRLAENFTIFGEENCLYLNVFSPNIHPTNQTLKPVMVWIHGGGYIEGNSNLYGPDNLIKQDIVVVTFNYRLGPFGFLSTGDITAPGNYALKDQNLVLKWIQKNIKNFSGDPAQVTVAGESAGAASIIFHMQSPRSVGLFHKAITASGSSLCQFSMRANPEKVTKHIADQFNITTTDSKELIKQLQKVDVDDFMSKVTVTTRWFLQQGLRNLPFSPSIEPQHEDAFITQNSYETLANGTYTKVPVLSGVNNNEILFFKPIMDLILILLDLVPSLIVQKGMNVASSKEKRELGLEIRDYYFENKSFALASRDEFYNYLNDDHFYRPIMKTNELLAKDSSVYFYVFSYVGDLGFRALNGNIDRSIKGVAHMEDVWYLWPKNFELYPNTTSDRLASQRLARLWGNFVKYANPTPTPEKLLNNIKLPPITSNGTYLKIGEDLTLAQNFRQKNLQFWEELYKKYAHRPFNSY